MLLKTIKWLLLVAIVLLLGLIAVFHFKARSALDQEYTHSRETGALPVFSAKTTDGLVRVAANGYEFRVRVAGFGPKANGREKPAVVLLHGFPVTSAMWNALIDPLQEAGYRVLALDQRGYSPGARPSEVSDYTTLKLSKDVIAVANAVGLKKFHLVGHDWGAVVGWTTIMRRPNRVLSWTALSIAHPAAFSAALENDPDQKSRSRYFMLFITPWLPETLFSYNDFEQLKTRAWGRMSAQQREEYLKVFSEPGALSAALNWYRAMTISREGAEEMPLEVATPTLFIWGNQDGAVGRVAVESQAEYMTGPYREIELDAGHWLLVDEPERVIKEVLMHLEENRRSGRGRGRVQP